MKNNDMEKRRSSVAIGSGGSLRGAGDKLTELVRGQRKLLRTLEQLQEGY